MSVETWPVALIGIALCLAVLLVSGRRRHCDPEPGRLSPSRHHESAVLRVAYLVYAALCVAAAVIGFLVLSALDAYIAAFAVAVTPLLAAANLVRLAGPSLSS
jgi:cytochrome b561